jgi:hypothetical protein
MTLSAAGAQTVTTASSLYVDTPVAGTNVTITNNKPIDTATGAYLSSAGVWTNVSSGEVKENFTTLNFEEILAKIGELPVQSWNYKTEGLSIRHVGPVAEDFYNIFGIGNDDKHLAALDTAGVALAGIKGVLQRIDTLEINESHGTNVTNGSHDTIDMTVLGKLSAQGALEVGGTATFHGETVFEKLVSFLGDIIFKGKVFFAQSPVFNKDTAGSTVIKSGTGEIKVEFEKEYEYTPVVNLTLRSPVKLDYMRVKDESTKGFAIEISPALSQDIGVNWIAVAVKDNHGTHEPHETNGPHAVSATPAPIISGVPTPAATDSATPIPSPAATAPQPTATPAPTIPLSPTATPEPETKTATDSAEKP